MLQVPLLNMLGFGGNRFVIYVLVAIAGAATIGAQNIVQAYVSQYYPAIFVNGFRDGFGYR